MPLGLRSSCSNNNMFMLSVIGVFIKIITTTLTGLIKGSDFNIRHQTDSKQQDVIMKESIIGFALPIATGFSNCRVCSLSKATVFPIASTATPSTALAAGLANVAAEQLADYTAEAIQFFSSERVTAALITGASISSLFSLVKFTGDIYLTPSAKRDNIKNLKRILTRLYHFLCIMSVLLSLNVVVISTLASTTLMLDKHNGMAYSAYEFLFRELRYEFITTQWSFIVGLLCFIMSIAVRSVLEFDLLRKGRRKLASFVGLSFAALASHLLSYINATLHQWPNLAAMTIDLFWTLIHKAFNRKEARPLELLSVVFGGVAAILAATQLLQFETFTSTSTTADSNKDVTNDAVAASADSSETS